MGMRMGLLEWEREWDYWNGNENGTTGMGMRMGLLEWEREWDCSLEVAGASWAA